LTQNYGVSTDEGWWYFSAVLPKDKVKTKKWNNKIT